MKRMFLGIVATTVAAGFGTLAAQSPPPPADSKQSDSKQADSKQAEAPVVVGRSGFYPLEIGTEWKYDLQGQTVVARVTKHEKIGEHAAGKVASFLGKKTLSSEHIAVTNDGVYRVAFGGETPTKPVLILKLPPKDGDVWAVDTEISGSKITGAARCDFEKLELPAGKFDTFRVTGSYTVTAPDGGKQEPSFKFWFADGTGVVKLATSTPDGEVVLELKSFQRGQP